jgi:hypothetical protein
MLLKQALDFYILRQFSHLIVQKNKNMKKPLCASSVFEWTVQYI